MRLECGPEWDTRIITINPKPLIGVLMSGGIDSWVLFNILKLDLNMPKIVIFNIKRDDGYDSAETIKLLTGRNEIIEIDELTTQHNNRVPTGIEYILENYGIDELYTGVNIIPHTEYFPEFITDARPGRSWSIPPNAPVKCPFNHLYKYHIIDLADRYNIDLKNTHSCIDQNKGHCGVCWQCLEKQWGYNQLKIKERYDETKTTKDVIMERLNNG